MKHNLKCEECGESFIHNMQHTKSCSDECRKRRMVKKFGRYSDKSIPSGTVGAITELVISADLMKKGYSVFRALSPSCFCDVIAIKDNNLLKVEIKTGYVGLNKKVLFPKSKNTNIDIYGVYSRLDNQCFYFDNKFIEINI